jgi:hypothetical protein
MTILYTPGPGRPLAALPGRGGQAATQALDPRIESIHPTSATTGIVAFIDAIMDHPKREPRTDCVDVMRSPETGPVLGRCFICQPRQLQLSFHRLLELPYLGRIST